MRAIYLISKIALLSILPSFMTVCSQAQELSALSHVESGTYKIDENHSYILFSYNHSGLMRSQALLHESDETLALDVNNSAISDLEITINPSGVVSNVAAFGTALKTNPLLKVENHPLITLSPENIEQLTTNEGMVQGNLTIFGTTHPIKFQTKLIKAGPPRKSRQGAFGFSATGAVKRSDWGLDLATPAVSDEVLLVIEVMLVKSQQL